MIKLLPYILIIFLASACGNKKESNTKESPAPSSGKTEIQAPPIQNGLSEKKHKNGTTYMRGYYKDGKREGLWLSFYETGIPWSEAFYEKGIRNGKAASFYENGKKRYEGNYKDDKQVGPWKFFDESGKLVQEIDFDKEK